MSKKERKKEVLFEEVEFSNREEAEKKMKLSKIWLIICAVCAVISIPGTVIMSTVGFDNNSTAIFALLGVVAAALVSGRFIDTIKFVFKMTKIGYRLVPFYIIDLIGALIGMAIGLLSIIYIPALSCLYNLGKSFKSYKKAKEYVE